MYAIIRTEKLKTFGNTGGLNAHLIRSIEVPNADKELFKFNHRMVGSNDLSKDVKQRLNALKIEPRKNAVLAIEHLMTASPEAFELHKNKNSETGETLLKGTKEAVERWNSFKKNCNEWLAERYGKGNIINFTCHLDEKTPHIHAIVVPIDTKGKLNCRDFLGGRELMQKMQSSFAEKMKPIGLERGIEGSKAEHTKVQKWYAEKQVYTQQEIKEYRPLVIPTLKNPSIEVSQDFLDVISGKISKAEYEKASEKLKSEEIRNRELIIQIYEQERFRLAHLNNQSVTKTKSELKREKDLQKILQIKENLIKVLQNKIEKIAKGEIKIEDLLPSKKISKPNELTI